MDNILSLLKKLAEILSKPLFEISGNSISLMAIILAVIIFTVTIICSRLGERFVKRVLKEKGIDRGVKGTIERFTRYLILLIGALITLDTIGISVKSLAALGAVLMVGIGFGLQNIAQNFISGLIILLERPIKVGDLVEVKGISGRVVEIGARSTLIHTRDDVAIIVPNSQFISEQVVNDSFSGDQKRLYLNVGVAYGSDVQKVREILLNVAEAHPSILKNPAPNVFFSNFGDSSLDFKLLVWIQNVWVYEAILSDLRFKVDEEFRNNNITIPFPQRDLHFKSSDVKFN